MKKLSRKERLGAAALAVVAIGVTAGTLLLRGVTSATAPMPQVTVIHTSADAGNNSATGDSARSADGRHSDKYSRKGRKEREDKGKADKGKRKKQRKRKTDAGGRETGSNRVRDLLSEPIPVSDRDK